MASTRPAYLAFAAFGSLWGVWGAALPAIRDAAGVDEARLGVALLFIGVGALPAMVVVGRAVDRFGGRVVGLALVALAAAGIGVAGLAAGPASLVAGMLVLGATSGAADVGANAVAAAAERQTGRSVLTRAHGTFSAAVVVGSLVTGALQLAGASVVVAFGLVMLVAVAAAVSLRAVPAAAGSAPAEQGGRRYRWVPLLVVGLVGALAFAVENAHQSWGAVFLADELQVVGGLTAAAPAVFAAVAAAARFAVGAVPPLPAGQLLVGGAAGAAVGSWVLSVSTTTPVALLGLAVAAAGSAVLFPTLLREVVRDVPDASRGRATSVVASTAYAGFVLGPALVGAVAQADGLRAAFAVVAAIAAVTTVLARPVARWAGVRAADPGDQPDEIRRS